MQKLLYSLALCAAAWALVACVSPIAPAQTEDKKDEKKEEKKDAKKEEKKDVKPADPGTIEVYQSKDGWRYRVLGTDGKPIAIGVQGYAKKEDCVATIEVLKAALVKAKVVELGAK